MESRSPFPRGDGKRLLVVDDDATQLRVMKRILAPQGYEVHTATSGEEAVTYIADNPQDLVLLDVVMEGMDGLETLQAIRERYQKQRAILFSGYSPVQQSEIEKVLGKTEFLSKPIHPDVLLEAVGRVLADPPPSSP